MHPQCDLTDDEIESRSNPIRIALSELVNTSVLSLKEAYQSQATLSLKISELEKCLKPANELSPPPNFKKAIKEVNSLKERVDHIYHRIEILNQRFSVLETKVQS